MKSITTLLAIALLVAACSPEAKEAKQKLAAPVNCATAKGDIHMLNSVKATVGKEMLEGVTAFIPAGFVIGAVTDTEGDKLEVAGGEYNKKIDAKIKEIKDTCGL